ncbi:hypothetical protein KP509_34G054600 [Ceratopteris richardii]|nr:hypothetical protein KP509_34G054600 [Ceratopteris richardii]
MDPLRTWIVVDYIGIFAFRILMFIDNGLASGLGPHNNNAQTSTTFMGRVLVLMCLAVTLYPFLWVWTILGSVWFTNARDCINEGQKWGFLVWLLLCYCGLICIACLSTGKWLIRRQVHLHRVSQGSTLSEWQVLLDLIRVPDRAAEGGDTGHDARGVGLDTATYHPGLFLTQNQREAVEGLIQQLPKFRLKGVPTDCSECPICLEEFHAGSEVRGLPCAHNFHVACIDEWLRLNIKCPRCRCSVFPNLDLSALVSGSFRRPRGVASIYFGGDATARTSAPNLNNAPSIRYIRAPVGESNLLRLQQILRTMRIENGLPNDMSSNQIDGTGVVPDGGHLNMVMTENSGRSTADQPNSFMLSDTVVVVERSPPARF